LQEGQTLNFLGSLDGINIFPQRAITGVPIMYPSVTDDDSA
jgi:hypothetical protein